MRLVEKTVCALGSPEFFERLVVSDKSRKRVRIAPHVSTDSELLQGESTTVWLCQLIQERAAEDRALKSNPA